MKKSLFIVPFALIIPLIFAGCDSAEPKVDSAVISATLQPATCGKIGNLHKLGEFYLASQPAPSDFDQAKEDGIKTVINLRHDRENQDFDEKKVVTGKGLNYVSLPWNGPDELTDELFAQARQILNTEAKPMMIHCGSANRVGAIWIPWRVLDGGISVDDAVAEAKTIGLSTPEYEAKARDYVKREQGA